VFGIQPMRFFASLRMTRRAQNDKEGPE